MQANIVFIEPETLNIYLAHDHGIMPGKLRLMITSPRQAATLREPSP
ncbi:MAG: hypothetical protein PVI78_02870 [Anaerolineales bacterium]